MDRIPPLISRIFEIWGGSPSLMLPGVWFSWVNTSMMLAALRRVGFAGGRIGKSLIDRTHFIDRVEVAGPSSPSDGTRARAMARSVDEVVITPPGMRGRSAKALAAKLDALTSYAKTLESAVKTATMAPFDPSLIPGLVTANNLDLKKRKGEQVNMEVYEGGSCSLRNINTQFKEKRAKVQEKADGVEARKTVRVEKKTAAEESAAKLIGDFERCRGEVAGCVCGVSPCPVASLKRCGTCHARQAWPMQGARVCCSAQSPSNARPH